MSPTHLLVAPAPPPACHPAPSPPATGRARVGLAAWVLAGTAFAASGWFGPERGLAIPGLIVGSAAALVLVYRARGQLHALGRSIDLRWVLAFHGTRLPIGAWFLVEGAAGRLDPTFVAIGGWGDVAAGGLALALLPAVARDGAGRRRLLQGWNLFALLDILATFAAAQYVFFLSGHPETMWGLLRFPGPLLATFIVPLVLATHALVWARRHDRLPAPGWTAPRSPS